MKLSQTVSCLPLQSTEENFFFNPVDLLGFLDKLVISYNNKKNNPQTPKNYSQQ